MEIVTKKNQRAKLEWSDIYGVSIDVIDNQHRGLFRLINEVSEMADLDSSSKEKCFSALNATIRYAENHFKTEENYLQKYGYPQFLQHKKEHDGFVEEIFSMVEGLEDGLLTLGGISILLKNWFSEHFRVTDQQYKAFLLEKPANSRQDK